MKMKTFIQVFTVITFIPILVSCVGKTPSATAAATIASQAVKTTAETEAPLPEEDDHWYDIIIVPRFYFEGMEPVTVISSPVQREDVYSNIDF